jgi:FAD/FMN-containing dehydrogenase
VNRRDLIKTAMSLTLLSGTRSSKMAYSAPNPSGASRIDSRARLGDAAWPSEVAWKQLDHDVGGALVKVRSPLTECLQSPTGPECAQLFKSLKNPYFIGDEVGLTQTLGWVDAWTSMPSTYAVAARTTGDVVAAVNFARQNNLRLVVKGGGHSYQGTSNAADSLLVWTRRMSEITLHDSFVGSGCDGHEKPTRAVTVGAGSIWAHVYDAVTTRAGGYVQGGGCMTVGVAGLVQSGGFGSFSKAYGTAAGSLLEAEVVTADGVVRIANACTNPELFWGLKGGGGGSLGVITRVTLRVHDLPESFGAVNITIEAASDRAFLQLIKLIVDFYSRSLMNPHWGEQIRFRRDNVLQVQMVFQGFNRSQAQAVWRPFLDSVEASQDFKVEFSPLKIVTTSARTLWAPTMLKRILGFISTDDRPGAPGGNVFWPGDQGQAGQMLHGYESAWLPARLLRNEQRQAFSDAVYAATRHWSVSFHFNKGLAGAPAEAVAAAKDTAMNPAVLDAFALVICGAEGPPAYPGIVGHEPDAVLGRQRRQAIDLAMDELRKLVPNPGSYVSESNFFEANWQQSFWGANYSRLLAVKAQYDPEGIVFVHHGVGSEQWSEDGFTRL